MGASRAEGVVGGAVLALALSSGGCIPTMVYTQTIKNVGTQPSGSLGTVKFGKDAGNVNLIFTFTGSQRDVVPYLVPTTKRAVNDGQGFEIVAGTATVVVQDARTGATRASATFLPDAGIFVSIDNGNAGIGFGAHGSLPGGPTWPNLGMEVAYPYAMFLAPPTDLKSAYQTPLTGSDGISCVGFNGSPGTRVPGVTCNVPPALPTTAGDLIIDPDLNGDHNAFFTVEVK